MRNVKKKRKGKYIVGIVITSKIGGNFQSFRIQEALVEIFTSMSIFAENVHFSRLTRKALKTAEDIYTLDRCVRTPH